VLRSESKLVNFESGRQGPDPEVQDQIQILALINYPMITFLVKINSLNTVNPCWFTFCFIKQFCGTYFSKKKFLGKRYRKIYIGHDPDRDF
jgi:hypothetical protein